ncbi:fasting-inducible integral membrane protein tm6p1-related [Holotrichia oblita]|uniref:Fasting-inducible integral membrane protein tm6p1-related n=1 Tax=Holotrichia oblita TaxID=644536 RepID=A0ACB9SSZ1_HOLOL|nr:fasting-inducible integral membrane protein tm6p1-related [Holotrichia oblita]
MWKIIGYSIAVYNDHVYPTWPYISDTAVIPPESCILSQLFAIGCILQVVVIYYRYLLIKHTVEIYSLQPIVTRMNKSSVWIGFTAVLGVSIISNFQKKTASTTHFLGVMMAFGLGSIYKILHIILSIILYPKIGSKLIIGVRIAITCVCGTCLIMCAIFGYISFNQYNGKNVSRWLPQERGYTYHVISTVSEWITAIPVLLFLVTYAYEFKDILIYKSVFEIPSDITNIE